MTSPAVAAPRSEDGGSYLAFEFNRCQEPKDIGDALQDCFASDICRAAISIVAGSAGIDLGGTVDAAALLLPKSSAQNGEEFTDAWTAPEGQSFCRIVKFDFISVAPRDGDRAVATSMSVARKSIGAYNWIGREDLFGAHGWSAGVGVVMLVQDDNYDAFLAAGRCEQPRQFVDCRGRASENRSHNVPGLCTVTENCR